MKKSLSRIGMFIFIPIKNFLKKYMNTPYSYVRKWILYFIHTKRRQDQLKAYLKKHTFFPLTYRDISFLIALDPQNGYIDEKIFDKGYFEEEMLDAFMEYITPGMTFVDVGANIGQHSLFVSRLVGPTGHVISFEPIKHLYEQMKKSKEANAMNNIDLINAGCGEKIETKELYLDAANIGASSVLAPIKGRKLETVTIHIMRAEDALLPYTKIDLIKIDVEGYEYQALLGLERIIARDKPVLFIEYSPTFYKRSKQGDGDDDGIRLLTLLQKYDYKVKDLEGRFVYPSKDLVLWGKEFDEATKDRPHQQINIICTSN
jgi:FkbM family methyltransferase